MALQLPCEKSLTRTGYAQGSITHRIPTGRLQVPVQGVPRTGMIQGFHRYQSAHLCGAGAGKHAKTSPVWLYYREVPVVKNTTTPSRPASKKNYNRPVPPRKKNTTAPSRLGKKQQPPRPASGKKNDRPVPPRKKTTTAPSRLEKNKNPSRPAKNFA